MSAGILQTASGFTFDYQNLYGEGKVTAAEIAAIRTRTDQAHAAIGHMRATGEVQGHLSKDGAPEKVLFTQLPYIADGHLNSPASIARLKAFGASLRNRVDTVVSFGIGGSYLGNKVLFDVTAASSGMRRQPKNAAAGPSSIFPATTSIHGAPANCWPSCSGKRA